MIKVFLDDSPLESGHALRGIGSYTRNLKEALQKNEDVVLVGSEEEADLVHYPYFGLFFNTLKNSGKPTVVTVYDVIPLIYPKYYTAGIRGKLKFLLQKNKLKKVEAVITISETSKKDIIRFLDIPEEKIYPIHLAPSRQFRMMSKNTPIHMGVSRKYKLPERFVLYVGDVNYNKNIPNFLKAFAILRRENKEVGLVLVGKAFKEDIPETREILQLIKELDLEDKIIIAGFVPDEDLAKIYNLATVYCQPSFYEGFGLPVLEAMACGTPVAAAKTQALVEIAEDKAQFFNPKDPEDTRKVLSGIINSLPLRKKLSRDGILHSNKFSWDKVADETIKVYSESRKPRMSIRG